MSTKPSRDRRAVEQLLHRLSNVRDRVADDPAFSAAALDDALDLLAHASRHLDSPAYLSVPRVRAHLALLSRLAADAATDAAARGDAETVDAELSRAVTLDFVRSRLNHAVGFPFDPDFAAAPQGTPPAGRPAP